MYIYTKKWNDTAIQLNETLGLDVQQPVLWKHMEVAANHFCVNGHLFDMSNINPGFSHHCPPAVARYEKKLYFLQDGHHFHYIINIIGVIRNFKCDEHIKFCETCFKIYDRRYVDNFRCWTYLFGQS